MYCQLKQAACRSLSTRLRGRMTSARLWQKLVYQDRPKANVSRSGEVRVKGVAASRTAEQQALPAGLVDTPAVVAGPRRVGGIDLDDFEARAFGLVAEDVEDLPVGPRTVMVASLPPPGSGALPDAIQPLYGDGAAPRVEGKPYEALGRLVLEVLGKPCFPPGNTDEGPRAGASAFGPQLAPDPPEMLLLGLQVSGGEEVRIPSRAGNSKVASPGVHPEDAAHSLLGLFADQRNVEFVAVSSVAAFVGELRGLDGPTGRFKVSALEPTAAVAELLTAFHCRDRDDALVRVDTEVPAPATAF